MVTTRLRFDVSGLEPESTCRHMAWKNATNIIFNRSSDVFFFSGHYITERYIIANLRAELREMSYPWFSGSSPPTKENIVIDDVLYRSMY